MIYGPRVDFRDFTDPVVEIDGLAVAHDALLDRLEQFRPAPTTATRLPGWSIGHVLTHIEHNADGYRAVLAGEPQYESYQARDRAIDAAAHRSLDATISAMHSANDALVAAFRAETDFGRTVQMLVRSSQPGLMTLGRRREIEVHHLDLDLGRTPAEIDAGYMARDAAMLTAWWEAKNREPLPGPLRTADVRARWLWLVGRSDIDGVDAAGLF